KIAHHHVCRFSAVGCHGTGTQGGDAVSERPGVFRVRRENQALIAQHLMCIRAAGRRSCRQGEGEQQADSGMQHTAYIGLVSMRRHWAAFIGLTLTASPAFAQYVANITPNAGFPALSGGTTIALQAPAMADPADRGRADVALGFTFPFYNRQYTTVTVTANGMLFFEPSTAANITSDFGF